MPLSPLIILVHPSTMHLPALTPFALFCLCVAAQVPQYVCPHFATQISFLTKSSGDYSLVFRGGRNGFVRDGRVGDGVEDGYGSDSE